MFRIVFVLVILIGVGHAVTISGDSRDDQVTSLELYFGIIQTSYHRATADCWPCSGRSWLQDLDSFVVLEFRLELLIEVIAGSEPANQEKFL